MGRATLLPMPAPAPLNRPLAPKLTFLAATPEDRPFLRSMLVDAAFPPGTTRPVDPLADDHVARYLDGWQGAIPRPGDDAAPQPLDRPGVEVGLVARVDGDRVGAAWTRTLPAARAGYGFVADYVPELTVAVAAAHRGEGIGRGLVAGVLDLAAIRGAEQVSLSVADSVNPGAARLYESLGFVPVGRDDGGSLTMVTATRPAAPVAPATPGTSVARRAVAADGPALARLREVMFAAAGRAGSAGWVRPFLARWAGGFGRGRLTAAVVDDPRGRPVASAIASFDRILPGPGREDGRQAYVSSVATEPGWRRRGAADACLARLMDEADAAGFGRVLLMATPEAASIYTRRGFRRVEGAMIRHRP